MNSYELSRNWFDWSFENPEKISPNHSALYFFIIEHCNRLGWKEKFGLPTTMAKESIGIRSYNTYINTLNDLVDFGFIKLIEKSKNQYSSNIIALSNFNKATDKALDKAMIKHATKQSESISSINKQETRNKNNKEIILDSWIDYRKQIKKPIKDATIQSILTKMENYSDDQCKHVINNSIQNGYQGLFWENLPANNLEPEMDALAKHLFEHNAKFGGQIN
jgi:hypothetical protein